MGLETGTDQRAADRELGQRLELARLASGYTVKEFAEKTGVYRQKIRAWERGDFGSEEARPTKTKIERRLARETVQAATGLPDTFFAEEYSDVPAMIRRLEELVAKNEELTEALERLERSRQHHEAAPQPPSPETR